jgi:hypothetical protein
MHPKMHIGQVECRSMDVEASIWLAAGYVTQVNEVLERQDAGNDILVEPDVQVVTFHLGLVT